MTDQPPAGSAPGERRADSPPGGLPPELERFGAQLERATSQQATRARARRRVLSGAAIAAVAAVAVYAGVALLGGSNGGPAQVPTASALDKAAAALHAPAGAILHVHMIGTQDNGDGTTVTWQDESWQSTSPPYQRRQVEQAPDEPRSEGGTIDGRDAVYDASTNTIYVSGEATTGDAATGSDPAAAATTEPTPSPPASGATTSDGKAVLTAISGSNLKTLLTKVTAQKAAGHVTAGQLRIVQAVLRKIKAGGHAAGRVTIVVGGGDGNVAIKWTQNGKPIALSMNASGSAAEADNDAGSADGSSDAADDVFREQALAALRAPSTRAVGHVTIDGREALKIVVSSSVTYLVDAQTYDPIEWITKGDGGGVTLRFAAYELLQPTAANQALLSLTAQHPGATVDTSAQDYTTATSRLYPHG